MANVAKQIIGSFEDLGKDIIRETAKLPTEILLGSSKPKQQVKPVDAAKPTGKPLPPREWLNQFAAKSKPKEPTVQERLEKEKREKEEKEQKLAVGASKMAPIKEVSTKRKRGDLLGIQQSSEKGKNARQD